MAVSRIQWSDDYKLGLPVIDAEHKELADICNQFLAAVEAEEPVSILAAILGSMIERTRAHFRAEENMLDRQGYPALVGHKAEHERLLLQAEVLKARFTDTSRQDDLGPLTMEAAQFLQTWLLEHIRTNDRPYRPFLMSLS